MKLSLQKYTYPALTRVDVDGRRHYKIPEFQIPVPSVTTLLSHGKDLSFLTEWRNRIGDAEADKISEAATRIGDRLHLNMENYLLHGSEPTGNYLTKVLSNLIIKGGLSKIDEVYGSEVPLYYPGVYAGTADLIAAYNGKMAIVDFKNSSKLKAREHIGDYFMQLVAYALAHNEVYGTNISTGVVMMACHTGDYLEFVIEGDEFRYYAGLWAAQVAKFYKETAENAFKN